VGRTRESRDALARELFVAHYARLAGWVLRLVDDEGTAHEVAAEAFTRLLARWGSVEDPRAFLYVTATSLLKDHWRKVERERAAPAKVPAEVAPVPAALHERPSLRDVVDRLPEPLRVVVVLHYYADLPAVEVAGALGLSQGRVDRRLREARALLHDALEAAR
jgi:RNA polymerase sigma-70 factor, ECF subfamily